MTPDFNALRQWISAQNGVNQRPLLVWVDKFEQYARELDDRLESLMLELGQSMSEGEHARESLQALRDAIADHRRGLLDGDELHALLD